MKYLKTYYEAIGVKLNSELKSTVEALLIDLRDEEFDTKVSEIDYHSQKERVKVVVSKGKEFTYGDIKTQIESVWSYLSGEGFKIEHFTCVEDWENFEEPEDNFTIYQNDKGYVWDQTDTHLKYIEKEFQRRPEITKSEIYDPMTFDRVNKFTFEISFIKDKIEVDKTRGHLSTNEELDPETYLSAATQLQSKHPQRSELLRKYGEEKAEELKRKAEELKRLQEEAYKKSILEEGKKLGQFNLFFEKRGQFRRANCYFQFLIGEDYYSDCLNDWMNSNTDKLWMEIQVGLQPVSEKDLEVIEWFLGDDDYFNWASRKSGIFWNQNAYTLVSNEPYKVVDGSVEVKPDGSRFHFEEYEFNAVKCSDRNEAARLKKVFTDLFNGDIDYKQPNEKYFKDVLNEMLCENDLMSISYRDYEKFIDSTYDIRLNKLYKTPDPSSIIEDEN